MKLQVPIILITCSFTANSILTSGKSIHNSTMSRGGKAVEVNDGSLSEKFAEWLGKKIDIKEDLFPANHTKRLKLDHKRKLKVKKAPRRNQASSCSRPMSNVSDPFLEVKQYLAHVPESSTTHTSQHMRQAKSKKVLEKWQRPEFDVTAGMPDSSPRPDTVRHGNWPKVTHLTLHDVLNQEGKLENLELCLHELESADLHKLIKSLDQAETVKKMFLQLKEMDDIEILKQAFHVNTNDKAKLLDNVEMALDFLKEFELKIHKELRKPEKKWNYSEEENN